MRKLFFGLLCFIISVLVMNYFKINQFLTVCFSTFIYLQMFTEKDLKKIKLLGWYRYKILCEFGWWVRVNVNYSFGEDIYYKNLRKMVDKYNINLYGDKL